MLFERRRNSKMLLFDSATVRPSIVGPADVGMSACPDGTIVTGIAVAGRCGSMSSLWA